MYPMSPDMPRRFYAERLQSWEQDRNARLLARARRTATPATRRRSARRAVAQIVSARRGLSPQVQS
jgi:hypothetical protein